MKKKLFVTILCFGAITAQGAPNSDLWEDWLGHDEKNKATVSHALFQQVLDEYVSPEEDGINRVAYDITSKPPGTIEWE